MSAGQPDQPDRRRFCAAVAGGGLVLATGCRSRNGDAPRLASASELAPAERLYGLAPHRDADVVYQPDVVIVGDGARSIVARSNDGLVWGIDSGARNLDRVREGQILFVTGNCVGRVLGLKREGDVTAVVLGPADLTEILRECRMELDQPFDPSQASSLAAPEFPGARTGIRPAVPWHDWDDEPAGTAWRHPGHVPPTWQPASSAGPSGGDGAVKFVATPILDPLTIGLRAQAWNESVNVLMTAALRLRNASISFNLDLAGAKVRMARLALTASPQLRFGFDAKAQPGRLTNIRNASRMIPLDLNLPFILSSGGIGLGVSLQHRILVNTAFSAQKSWFNSRGQWDLDGTLAMHYANGVFRPPAQVKITQTHESVVQNMKHVSFGVSAMVLTHQIRLMVGLGAGGFRAGPFLACNSSLALARGSNLAQPLQPHVCRIASLSMGLGTGMGYEIPGFVAEALNFFLRALRIKEVQPSGGVMGPVFPLLKPTTHYMPDNDFCRDAAAGTPA